MRNYLRLTLASLPHEVFLCLFLDPPNRMVASEELFRGTLTRTAVYPREVARQALVHNAAGIIVAHNHPRGTTAGRLLRPPARAVTPTPRHRQRSNTR